MTLHASRSAAKVAGAKKYSAAPCLVCGHEIRYSATGQCVRCVCARATKWAKDNPAAHNERCKQVKLRHPERYKAYSKKWMRKRLGLPEATRPCPDRCESCARIAKLRLDHDHVTGEFRGWLCNQCNTGLGLLGDDIIGIFLMSQYLARNT